MRQRVIEFLVCYTSYSYEELDNYSNEELDALKGKAFNLYY